MSLREIYTKKIAIVYIVSVLFKQRRALFEVLFIMYFQRFIPWLSDDVNSISVNHLTFTQVHSCLRLSWFNMQARETAGISRQTIETDKTPHQKNKVSCSEAEHYMMFSPVTFKFTNFNLRSNQAKLTMFFLFKFYQ